MRTLAVIALLALAGPALAQPVDPGRKAEAERRFQAAERLYRDKQYLPAAAEYQAAYDLSGLPGLLYNVAQSYRLGGETAVAAETYRLFLERAPDHSLAAVARGHLEALERELAIRVEPAPPAVPAPIEVSARRAPPPRGRGLRAAGLASAGIGLVALGAALHYGIEANQASDAISENDEGWTRSLLDRYDEGQRAETRMFVLSAIGGTALVAGGVLYYLGWRQGRDLSLSASGTGASITMSGNF
jgi:tetratricopeptide (TPR) repeat protein